MRRIQIAVLTSLVLLGATNILTAPETVTYKVALPAKVAEEGLVAVVDEQTVEPNYVNVPTHTPADRDCLAQNIYFEAKNQSIKGQLAVGIVTLKRVESSRFPNTICGAVKHTKHAYADGFPVKHKCQFSWYCDGQPDRPINAAAYEQAQHIANALLSHESGIKDFTDGADHYHADYIEPPSWTASMVKVVQIENHIFYTTVL